MSDEDWKGEFNLDDCEIKEFTPDLPDEQRGAWIGSGIELTHKPTGLNVKAYSSMNRNTNLKRAEAALRKRVEARQR